MKTSSYGYWTKSIRLAGLEIPEKPFPYRFFFEDGTGHPTWVIMAENGVFSEEWADMCHPLRHLLALK
jgi:hypothetical protein